MRKNILPVFLCLLSFPCFAEYVVKGGSGEPFVAKEVTSDNSTKVYLLNGLSGAEISYTSSKGAFHQWFKYKEGTNGEVRVPCKQRGNVSTITDIEDGYGYYVKNSADVLNHYLWIIDYSRYVPVFNTLTVDESDDKCDMIKLLINMDAPVLQYYTNRGIREEVVRNYQLDYFTMEWNSANKMFEHSPKNIKISGTVPEYIIDAPLQDTKFTLSGDQFAKHFNMKDTVITTKEYKAVAVKAEIITDSISNQITGTDGSFSAPVDFRFTAYANNVVNIYRWKIFNLNRNKTEPVYQIQTANNVLNYTFEDEGRYRVDLEVGSDKSVCTDSISVANIIISDFMLWVPNAFSPTTSPGVNDVFKVAYRSVIKFNAWIFNRWGNELFHWSDPSQGWDGKYHGKYVPPGTYFYVIEATSADGKKHIKKGDVNILGGR